MTGHEWVDMYTKGLARCETDKATNMLLFKHIKSFPVLAIGMAVSRGIGKQILEKEKDLTSEDLMFAHEYLLMQINLEEHDSKVEPEKKSYN